MKIMDRLVRWYWWDLRMPYKWKFSRQPGGYVVYLGGLCEQSDNLLKGTISLIRRQIKHFKNRKVKWRK